MIHSILAYWRHLESLSPGDSELPSPRVLRLLTVVFERWQSKHAWLDQDQMGHLFDYVPAQVRAATAEKPVVERRAMALSETLRQLTRPEIARWHGTMEIGADELILGTPPPYSVGQGKELMRYLTPEEALKHQLTFFNEWSPFGHICPDYGRLLDIGLLGLIEECEQRGASHEGDTGEFYRAVRIALEGVIEYAGAYAEEADRLATVHAKQADDMRSMERESGADALPIEIESQRAESLRECAKNLRHVPANPPQTLQQAIQSIYLVHIALHWTGDITSLGRLDQLLVPYYMEDVESGLLTEAEAQELIDCFWLKLDEKVVLNRRYLEDRFTDSDGALLGTFGPSNFDQGSLSNQWMQQVTLGGFIANDDSQSTDGTNALTSMMLAASRRMPLNSPTLDLRVHAGTTDELLAEAADTILSGGAHPILMNDERIIPRLHGDTGATMSLAEARDYVCDGCFETHIAGKTDFSFGFVPALDILQFALNGGANFASSGPEHLRGSKFSWRTAPAERIQSWDHFQTIFREHLLLSCHRFIRGILLSYGSKAAVSPTPLLSALIDGCIRSGRDFFDGGPTHHMFAPLMTGVSTAADSLWVIKHLVFEQQQFTLSELVSCLRLNWDRGDEVIGLTLSQDRRAEIRNLCIEGKKFGHGDVDVDSLAWQLASDFKEALELARHDPTHADLWLALNERYSTEGKTFELHITPGVGTFEQYVFGGQFVGATPDGRYAFDPIASDLSAAPLHSDADITDVVGQHTRQTSFFDALGSFSDPSIDIFSDGAPADFNIAEDFPIDELVRVLRRFADGDGGNMMTITTASPSTFAAAVDRPDQHELVRVRMGGWTEFFSVLFPKHKDQHRRRPLYVPRPEVAAP